MIVCNGCGQAVSHLGSICLKCSGRGVGELNNPCCHLLTLLERPTPLKSFLTPSQHRGSPDRWAKRCIGLKVTLTVVILHPPHSPRAFKRPKKTPLTSLSIPIPEVLPEVSSCTLANLNFSLRERSRSECSTSDLCMLRYRDQTRGQAIPRAVSPVEFSTYPSRRALNCVPNDVLCRSCFTQRFSIGTCELCNTAILGEREEGGPHVKGRAGVVWHAKCFVCQGRSSLDLS